MLSREDGGVAFVSSLRAAGVAAHFQKLSLDVVDVGGSGGCVWALGRLGLQCCGMLYRVQVETSCAVVNGKMGVGMRVSRGRCMVAA
jgi:hypothetical protein